MSTGLLIMYIVYGVVLVGFAMAVRDQWNRQNTAKAPKEHRTKKAA